MRNTLEVWTFTSPIWNSDGWTGFYDRDIRTSSILARLDTGIYECDISILSLEGVTWWIYTQEKSQELSYCRMACITWNHWRPHTASLPTCTIWSWLRLQKRLDINFQNLYDISPKLSAAFNPSISRSQFEDGPSNIAHGGLLFLLKILLWVAVYGLNGSGPHELAYRRCGSRTLSWGCWYERHVDMTSIRVFRIHDEWICVHEKCRFGKWLSGCRERQFRRHVDDGLEGFFRNHLFASTVGWCRPCHWNWTASFLGSCTCCTM